MPFKSYDSLRVFDVVAHHQSFTAAADELALTKGAVSYQIKRLEQELGFEVFERHHFGVSLTLKGKELWHASQASFNSLQQTIDALRDEEQAQLTVGLSTYFASRWLSPRLMSFIDTHPEINLRLQPMIDPADFLTRQADLTIRWGIGEWPRTVSEYLFHSDAQPVANSLIAGKVESEGLQAVLNTTPLLHDRESSVAWRDWFRLARMRFSSKRDKLVIPDPNVRVQAVIDGQGIALNDFLVANEFEAGLLVPISEIALSNYAYFLAYPKNSLKKPQLKAFRDWLIDEAARPRDQTRAAQAK